MRGPMVILSTSTKQGRRSTPTTLTTKLSQNVLETISRICVSIAVTMWSLIQGAAKEFAQTAIQTK
jgi:hypothetical protein